MEATAELEPTQTHTDKHRAPGRKQSQAARQAPGAAAAGSTHHAGQGTSSSGKQTDEDGGGGWRGGAEPGPLRPFPPKTLTERGQRTLQPGSSWGDMGTCCSH